MQHYLALVGLGEHATSLPVTVPGNNKDLGKDVTISLGWWHSWLKGQLQRSKGLRGSIGNVWRLGPAWARWRCLFKLSVAATFFVSGVVCCSAETLICMKYGLSNGNSGCNTIIHLPYWSLDDCCINKQINYLKLQIWSIFFVSDHFILVVMTGLLRFIILLFIV